MAVNLSGMKSMRYLLICRAGLAVSAESEAASTASEADDDIEILKPTASYESTPIHSSGAT